MSTETNTEENNTDETDWDLDDITWLCRRPFDDYFEP